MKNVLMYSIGKVVFIALFIYTSGEFYVNWLNIYAYDKAWMDGRIIEVDVELPLIPAILTIITGVIMMIVYFMKNRKSPKKLAWEEFEEKDEREVLITSKAVKGAYSSVVYLALFATAIITCAAPYIHAFPQLPIYLMGTVILIPTLIHVTVWCIEYRK